MRWTRSRSAISSKKVNWILDADIRAFFDAVDQEWLVRFLEHRIGDERIIRLIRKWLQGGRPGRRGMVTSVRRGRRRGR